MNPTLAHAAAFALDLAIKATLVFAVTAGLLFALRRASAATRHLVGTFGLAAALLLPVLTLALPRVPVPVQSSRCSPRVATWVRRRRRR